ncbi:DUF5131 family protein [Hoylesella oralis]|uniref:DUF5131 family protein n=1 Tax=Hoylesella oralis TaxID=28134 RepID=UPI0036F2048F
MQILIIRLTHIKINLKGIDRATVGGECNTLAQPMRKEWVVKLKEQVEKQGTAFFF